MKPREDNALEVWVGNTGVGWLAQDGYRTVSLMDRKVEITITMTVHGEQIDDARVFNLVDRHKIVSKKDLLNIGERAKVLISRDIPLYAMESSVPMRDETKFSWWTLVLSAEDYEWLFDHPGFEPVDSEIDQVALIEERTKQFATDMSDAINNMLHSTIMGGAGGLAFTGAVSSITSANDSTLTIAKLDDMLKAVKIHL